MRLLNLAPDELRATHPNVVYSRGHVIKGLRVALFGVVDKVDGVTPGHTLLVYDDRAFTVTQPSREVGPGQPLRAQEYTTQSLPVPGSLQAMPEGEGDVILSYPDTSHGSGPAIGYIGITTLLPDRADLATPLPGGRWYVRTQVAGEHQPLPLVLRSDPRIAEQITADAATAEAFAALDAAVGSLVTRAAGTDAA